MVKRLQEIDIIDANKKAKNTNKKSKPEKVVDSVVEATPIEKVVKVKKPPTEKQLAAVARMREARELKKQHKLKADEDVLKLQKKNERKLKRDEKLAKREAAEKKMIIESVKKEYSGDEEEKNIVSEVAPITEKVEILNPLNTPIKTQSAPPIVPIKTCHRIWKTPKYEKDFERGYKKMGTSIFGRPFHSGKRLH